MKYCLRPWHSKTVLVPDVVRQKVDCGLNPFFYLGFSLMHSNFQACKIVLLLTTKPIPNEINIYIKT